jgi:hypothetical protein
MALLLLLALQDPPEVVKGRDRLSKAIDTHDPKAADEAIAAMGRSPAAAKALVVALAKTRERLKSLDRQLRETFKVADDIDRQMTEAGSAGLALAKKLEAAKEKHEQLQSQTLKIEQIHDALRAAAAAPGPDALADELEKAGSWLARAELAELLGRVDHADVAPKLLARVEKETSDLALASLLESIALRGGAKGDWVKVVAARLEGKAWQARRGAIRALGAGGAKDAVEPLIATITKSDGLMRLECDAALRKIVGWDPGDPGRWPGWWSESRDAFLAGTWKAPPPKPAGGPGATKFYGLEVKSTRVAFVLDRSRTMDDSADASDPKGPRKVAVMRSELKNALAMMPNGARVNVIIFNDSVQPLSPQPRVLDDAVRKDVDKMLADVRGIRRTSTFDAIDRALAWAGGSDGSGFLDGIDTIYFLSDGESNYGSVQWPGVVERVVRRMNRPLRVAIHAIAVGDTGTLLKTIAADSGGEYVQK